jgi:hypothetical protein
MKDLKITSTKTAKSKELRQDTTARIILSLPVMTTSAKSVIYSCLLSNELIFNSTSIESGVYDKHLNEYKYKQGLDITILNLPVDNNRLLCRLLGDLRALVGINCFWFEYQSYKGCIMQYNAELIKYCKDHCISCSEY